MTGRALARADAPGARRGPLLIARVRGPRGVADAQVRAFADDLEEAVAVGAERVLVDLSDADRLETPGMNALLEARQRLLPRGGRVVVLLPRKLRRTFELLGLDRRFRLAPDRRRAADLLGLTPGAPHGA